MHCSQDARTKADFQHNDAVEGAAWFERPSPGKRSLLSRVLYQQLAGGVLRRFWEPCIVPFSNPGIRRSLGQELGA